jgi:hypothetical protein
MGHSGCDQARAEHSLWFAPCAPITGGIVRGVTNDAATFEDAFNLLCGDKIGEGCYRSVFECKLRPEWVVKVENGEARRFCNVLEDEFWATHHTTEAVKRWLAPCIHLSPDARLLIQLRTDPVPSHFRFPKQLPHFLNDVKKSNFGLLKGKLVTHDYAFVINKPNLRPVPATW